VSTEEIQDAAAPLLNHNFHTNITATYDDANNRILLSGAAAGGSGSAAPITNFYDIVRDFGAVSNEADSRSKIQNALNAARDAGGGTVYIPSGLWNLGAGLRIYSNTTLLMSKFAYMRKEYSGASMLWNGDTSASYSGYSGQSNIKIIGGDWDCRGTAYPSTPSNIFSFGHGDNIVIEQGTFRNVGGFHAIEINSSRTVRIKDCKFIGFIDTGGRSYSEAVQIDGAFRSTVFGEFGSYDKTTCKDVTVEGCYFGPSGFAGTAAWPTGVGSHSADTDGTTVLAERYHEEIKVVNNTFDGMTEYAVRSDAVWREAIIQGNNFSECAGGVGLGFRTTSTSNSWYTSFNISVQNNIFQQSKSTGRDCITARDIDGLVISGNHFRPSPAVTTGRHGIYLADCVEALVTSNRIEWVMQHGILLENSDDCMITNNMIKNVSTQTNNTYSFILIDLVSTRCSIIGNRMYRGTTGGNLALYGLRIIGGSGMTTFGNYAGSAATTPYTNSSTGIYTSTTNA
jgi:parallel beta-helix repeat protein